MHVIDQRIDLEKYKRMLPKDPHRIRDMAYYGERVKKQLFDPEQQLVDYMPWDCLHGMFDLRPGELTVWAGINGHRKSMIVGQVMLWVARRSRVCIASMEMKPEDSIHRMIRQSLGTDMPSPFGVDKVLKWGQGRIWLYDKQETVQFEQMLKVVNYVRHEYGIEHVLIDSLMKCDKRGVNKEAKGQARVDFVNDLQTYARDSGVHIHLVHHMRKGERESKMPGKFDVRGEGELIDLADNLVIVWSDKRQEREEGTPDVILNVAKQRHGRFEGDILLWMHQQSMQAIANRSGRAMEFFHD